MTGLMVVGVDMSLTGTGIASNHDNWTGLVGEKGITRQKGLETPLLERRDGINRLLDRIIQPCVGADMILLEGFSYASIGGASVERHVLWWKFMEWATNRHPATSFVVVPPNNRAQYATGRGGAPKHQVIDAVARRFPEYETKGNENIADAIVLMAMGMDHLGYPLTPMPATHRVALDKIEWPK